MSWGLLVVCLWVTFVGEVENVDRQTRLVNIAQGPVRGYKDPQIDVYAFLNIPYATVTERFKAPVPPPTWSQPLEAVDRGIICPQGPIFYVDMENKTMQEDCLIANIYVPDTEQTNLPVLVNVHGGAYQVGYGNNEPQKTLAANNNIITVNFNYRVGILGFLCLGTENTPGNAGMKDQVALLRWVKNNIANFGGNPNDITLSGCSAGSGAVNVLTLSATTKGLINKVISDSGASLGAFAVQIDPVRNAKDSARVLNFTNVDDLNALEEFYKTVPLDVLTSRNFMNNPNSAVTFGPCVEEDVDGEEFLIDSPYNILRQGDYERYPIIYGLTDMEGLLRIGYFPEWRDRMNNDFTDFLPVDLQFESEEQKKEVAETVKRFYFGTQPVSAANILSFVDYFTDVVFGHSMLRSVNLHLDAGNNTIYLYEYSFFDENTSAVPGTEAKGANHCAQSAAVIDEDETVITDEYRNMKRIMREMWADFIKTGNPVSVNSSLPSWPPVGANRSPHMSIGRTIELKGPMLEQRMLFWDDIYDRFYRAPEPPSATDSASNHKNNWLIYLLFISILYLWQ